VDCESGRVSGIGVASLLCWAWEAEGVSLVRAPGGM